MLQNIREHLQGWIAGVIITLICVSFALWGVGNYLGGGSSDNTVAKVNGNSITEQQLDQAVQRLRQQIEANNPGSFPNTQQAQAALKDQALRELINQEVLQHAVLAQGFRITQSQLDQAITAIPAFQIKGVFSQQRFLQLLQEITYSPQQFYADIEQSLLVNQIRVGIEQSSFVLNDETSQAIALADQSRSFNSVVIPYKNYLNSVTITDQQIQNYYSTNKADFEIPIQVQLHYIELSSAALKEQIKPTPAQLQQYYQDNIDAFSKPERWQIAEISALGNSTQSNTKLTTIAAALKSGKSIEQISKEYATDLDIKVSDPKWMVVANLSPIQREIVAKMQPGQVSGEFTGEAGLSVIQLIQHENPTTKAFNEVEDQVKNAWIQQQLQQVSSNASEQLANITYTNPDTLLPAAKALNLPIQTTAFFTEKGGDTDFTRNPNILAAAFSDNVLKDGNNSNLIQLDKSTLVVIRVNQSQPASIKPLTVVKEAILAKLKSVAAQQQAKATGDAILNAIKSGKSLSSVWQKYQVSLKQHTNATRKQADLDPLILQEAFSLDLPVKGKPSIGGVQLTNGDYAIVILNQVNQGSATGLSEDQKQTINNRLAQNFGQLEFNLYLQHQLKSAKIEIIKQ